MANYVKVLVLSLVLVGCHKEWPEDQELHGAYLEVSESAASFAKQEDTKARVRRMIEMSASALGQSPQVLRGWRIRIVGEVINGRAAGLADFEDRTISLYTDPYYLCVEHLALAHEMFHLAVFDPEHTNPLWNDREFWKALKEAQQSGHADCAPSTTLSE